MDVEVHRRDKPTRPFTEMEAIEIACPVEAKAKRGPGTWTPTVVVELEGGCSYERALSKARERAADRGADGIYGIETTVAENGSLVHMLAIPYRYKEGPTAPP
jgi:hypothetical protein